MKIKPQIQILRLISEFCHMCDKPASRMAKGHQA